MSTTILRSQSTLQRTLAWALTGVVFCGLVWAVASYFPGGVDWYVVFYPAARAVLSLQSPFSVAGFFNPPWAVIPLLPLALLPAKIAFAANFWISLIVTGYVSHRLGAKPLAVAAIVLSYPVLFMASYGQIDWLVYLGLILPPQWGLFFLVIKPQASIGIAIFLLIESLRQGGIKKVVFTFGPVAAALLLSVLVFGRWYENGWYNVNQNANTSLWPQSLAIGLAFLVYAIRQRRANLAITASPFLSPYLAPHGWGIALLGISPLQAETIAASIGIWVLRILTGQFLR